MHRLPYVPTAAGLLLLSLAATAQQGDWQVTMTELPLLPGGKYASAYAVNSNGKVLGVASDAAGNYHTVQWVNGQVSVIPDLGLRRPQRARGPQRRGRGRGHPAHLQLAQPRLFFGRPEQPSRAPRAARQRVEGDRARDQRAGPGRRVAQEGMPDLYAHAVVWYQGALQSDLGFMGGGTYSEALGINDLGAVVGVANASRTRRGAPSCGRTASTPTSAPEQVAASASRAHAMTARRRRPERKRAASIWENRRRARAPDAPGAAAPSAPAINVDDAGDIIATG